MKNNSTNEVISVIKFFGSVCKKLIIWAGHCLENK
jgi:hypothetical protein